MMKKLFLLCFMTVVCVVSSAQSKKCILSLPDRYKMQWNVNVGVLFNGVSGSNKLTQKAQWENEKKNGSFPALTGFSIGFGFDKSYGKSPLYGGLYIDFGTAGYKTKATKYTDSPYTSSSGVHAGYNSYKEEKYTLDMYNIVLQPTFIGYKYIINKSMMVSGHLGGFASYNLFGKGKYNEYSHSHYYYDGSDKDSNNKSESKISDMEDLSKFDAGLNLGIGFYYGHFNIDFSWMRGFVPISKGGSDTIKIGKTERKKGNLYESGFRISIGYTF